MKNLSVFQLVILGVFLSLAVIGVIVFATVDTKRGGSGNARPVIIWGTVPKFMMDNQFEGLRTTFDESGVEPRYSQLRPETYKADLLEAFATDSGPDLFFISQDQILSQKNKIYVVPFESYTERRFKDTFIEAGEIFLDPTGGVIAFPYIVDPLIMYWNRDILSAANLALPPKSWDQFFDLVPLLTKRDQSSNILQSAVALGEYRNVSNAKAVLSALMFQSGTPIVTYYDEKYHSALDGTFGFSVKPADAALRYYTEFSNPIKSAYSWNRSLPESRKSFLSEKLAFYFGFASELEDIRFANPNLNFDVSVLPQANDQETLATFGTLNGLAISRNASNVLDALLVVGALTSDFALNSTSVSTGLPPVSRTLLQNKPTDAVGPVMYDSAFITKTWLDPNAETTDLIFQEMVESVVSGRDSVSAAISNADEELEVSILEL